MSLWRGAKWRFSLFFPVYQANQPETGSQPTASTATTIDKRLLYPFD